MDHLFLGATNHEREEITKQSAKRAVRHWVVFTARTTARDIDSTVCTHLIMCCERGPCSVLLHPSYPAVAVLANYQFPRSRHLKYFTNTAKQRRPGWRVGDSPIARDSKCNTWVVHHTTSVSSTLLRWFSVTTTEQQPPLQLQQNISCPAR